MADITTLRGWLAEAETARHSLAMGQSVAEVWRDGRRMTFTKSSLSDLGKYIADLEGQIAKLVDEENGTTATRRRSISVIFGG